MGTEESFEDRVISSSTLATLRGILISSLSRENLGDMDVVQPPPRRRKVTFQDLHQGDAGAAPVDASQRHGASLNNARAAATPHKGKDASGLSQKEREDRIRNLRDRQNEERQKKLEELKSQALAAQKFREQKEEERRRRIDELRSRDTDRRYQVEERKRQIWEAERDRREAILRKNQEREARVDTKRRNERSSIVFAFGSSTPRMLEPADTGGSFWGTRRATSTSNVMMFSAVPLTRRSSERELDGSKKRAASASGLDRKPEDGDDVDASGDAPGYTRVHRKRTDLMPTIPSPRDTTPSRPSSVHLQNRPFSRSPGRAFSMSRLDQLSKPRRPPVIAEKIIVEKKSLGAAPSSVSRSMSHLVAGGEGKPRTALRKNDASRSMSQLAPTPPIPPPRPTRAERLRKRAREVANSNREKGLRSGEITPSRPVSAMSQQSVTSVSTSGVSLRHRPVATPRKPRPFSIAVTGVTQEQDARSPTYRHSISGEIRSSKAMQASVDRIENTKPPLPKPNVSKKPASAHPKPDTPARRAIKSAKTTPRATPKATPLQSPGTEIPPPISHEQPDTKKENKVEDKAKEEVKVEATSNEAVQVVNTGSKVEVVEENVISNSQQAEVVAQTGQELEIQVEEVPKPVVVDAKPIEKVEKLVEQTIEKMKDSVIEKMEEEVDMTASMIAKTRITTEEEAKAALAERRRLAREQAEREVELEKQRIEQERLAEEEQQRIEEEEQIKFEEEQLRLVEEARRCEEARLLLAIQENEKQQEEDRKRREEEAKAKLEREEADKKAREEAEKLRLEMDEKLKKEEEERVTRRKRVEAIMLRTRGKGNTPANTPTKDGDSEGDEGKDVSPSEEVKTDIKQSAMLAASSADDHVADLLDDAFDGRENGGSDAKTITSSASSELLLIDNTNGKPMEISDEDLTSDRPTNGHRNGVDYNNSVDFVNVDNMKQNKPSNNLLDFSEFESLSNVDESSTSTTGMDQIMTPTSGKFIHEDNVNSNIMNGPNAPFIAFSDNLTKKQDSNTVSDLLS